MMMIPRRNHFDLFDEMFRDPFFEGTESKVMKTDIKEKKDKYLIDIDLPGYEKEDIKMEISDGYLGECSRSFYVGENVKEEEIKAKFKNGTLTIEVPKKEDKKELPEKKYIPIE